MPTDSGGRDAILNTSAKLFSQQGYNGVSIRDIANACGVTNAALYYHFKNKEDLFLAMLQRDHEKVIAALREAAHSPGDLRADLRLLVARYVGITCQQRQSFQTLWRDLKNIEDVRAHRIFGEMRSDMMRPLEERIAAAQVDGEMRAGDARLYASLLYGMVMALTHESKTGRPGRVASKEIETVVDVFLDGVKRDK